MPTKNYGQGVGVHVLWEVNFLSWDHGNLLSKTLVAEHKNVFLSYPITLNTFDTRNLKLAHSTRLSERNTLVGIL